MNDIDKNINNLSWLTSWLSRVFTVTIILAAVLVLQASVLPIPRANAVTPAEAQCELEGETPGTNGYRDCVNVYIREGLTASQYCEDLEGGKDSIAYSECLERFIVSPVESGGGSDSDDFPRAINVQFQTCIEQGYSDEECDNFVEYGSHDGPICNGVAVSIGVDCDTNVNPIYSYIIAIINFLSAGVGIVVVMMVAIGGVQYMMAGGNPQATEAAIKRISNALIALVVFIFIWAFLNWLMPGGMI